MGILACAALYGSHILRLFFGKALTQKVIDELGHTPDGAWDLYTWAKLSTIPLIILGLRVSDFASALPILPFAFLSQMSDLAIVGFEFSISHPPSPAATVVMIPFVRLAYQKREYIPSSRLTIHPYSLSDLCYWPVYGAARRGLLRRLLRRSQMGTHSLPETMIDDKAPMSSWTQMEWALFITVTMTMPAIACTMGVFLKWASTYSFTLRSVLGIETGITGSDLAGNLDPVWYVQL